MGPEVISLVAVIGTTVSGILTTLFASRCSKIKCCGMECDREVMHTKEELELEKEELQNQKEIESNKDNNKIIQQK